MAHGTGGEVGYGLRGYLLNASLQAELLPPPILLSLSWYSVCTIWCRGHPECWHRQWRNLNTVYALLANTSKARPLGEHVSEAVNLYGNLLGAWLHDVTDDETDHAHSKLLCWAGCTDHQETHGCTPSGRIASGRHNVVNLWCCLLHGVRAEYTWESSRLLRQRKAGSLSSDWCTRIPPLFIIRTFLKRVDIVFVRRGFSLEDGIPAPRYSCMLHYPLHVAHVVTVLHPYPTQMWWMRMDSRGDSLHTLRWNEMECTVRFPSHALS